MEKLTLGHSPDIKIHLLARILFQLEDQVEVEDILERLGTNFDPLPLSFHYIICYMYTPIHRIGSLLHSPSFIWPMLVELI